MTDRADSTDDVSLIAHRGFAGENPENTVTAVRAATAEQAAAAERAAGDPGRTRADSVEIDVVPTADGDVVVFHDDELAGRGDDDRGLTDAEGVVWETDTETVTGAEVLGCGDTVPLLSEVLDAVPSDVGVNVELKNPGRPGRTLHPAEKLSPDVLEDRTAVWRPFVERVLDVVDAHDTDVLFSSFCEAALAATREGSDRPVAPILAHSIEDGLEIAREYDASAVHPPIEMVRGTPFFDASRFADGDLVAAAHDAGRDVNVWTVETWYEADRLSAADVDGIIADYSTLVRDRPDPAD